MISIIDCNIGNIGSVVNMFKHVGCSTNVISTTNEVLTAQKLVLPGVGNWAQGVRQLHENDLTEAIKEAVLSEKTPFFGICLGMQLLFQSSDEGHGNGLSLVPGIITQFDFNKLQRERYENLDPLPVPHMGWNYVKQYNKTDPVLSNLPRDSSFYFVHKYHATNVPDKNKTLSCNYRYEFVCGVRQENIWGFQFHPEKSHKFGMQIFKNFGNLQDASY